MLCKLVICIEERSSEVTELDMRKGKEYLALSALVGDSEGPTSIQSDLCCIDTDMVRTSRHGYGTYFGKTIFPHEVYGEP